MGLCQRRQICPRYRGNTDIFLLGLLAISNATGGRGVTPLETKMSSRTKGLGVSESESEGSKRTEQLFLGGGGDAGIYEFTFWVWLFTGSYFGSLFADEAEEG